MQDRTEARAEERRAEDEIGHAVREAQHGMRATMSEASEAAGRSREIGDSVQQGVAKFWERMAEIGGGPFLKGIAHTNLELVRLMRRRAKAYSELPAHLAHCRAPEDLAKEQARFVAEMMSDYQSSTQRLIETWMTTASSSAPLMTPTGADEARKSSEERKRAA
jgi:hypothetical protein